MNPNANRDELLALGVQMRTGAIAKKRQRAAVEEIENLEVSQGHREQALDLLAHLNRARPGAVVPNRMALICRDRQGRLFLEAARISHRWSAPLFDLAVAQRQQGRLRDAEWTFDGLIARSPDGQLPECRSEITRTSP